MKVKNCEECNLQFEYEPPAGYPDKRKYCHGCSEKKKATWQAKGEPKDAPKYIGDEVSKAKMVLEGKKEYHLSPEEVKCRALECAIASLKGFEKEFSEKRFLEIANEFVEWIYGN